MVLPSSRSPGAVDYPDDQTISGRLFYASFLTRAGLADTHRQSGDDQLHILRLYDQLARIPKFKPVLSTAGNHLLYLPAGQDRWPGLAGTITRDWSTVLRRPTAGLRLALSRYPTLRSVRKLERGHQLGDDGTIADCLSSGNGGRRHTTDSVCRIPSVVVRLFCPLSFEHHLVSHRSTFNHLSPSQLLR